MLLKLILTLGLIAVQSSYTLAADQCHSENLVKCEENVINWINTLPKGSLAHTEEEVDEMCKAAETTLKCEEQFIDKCLTPVHKSIVDLVDDGAYDLINGFCKRGHPLRNNYLKHAPCLSELSVSGQFSGIFDYIMTLVEKYKDVPFDKRALYECCAYRKGYNMVVDKAIAGCGEEAVNAVRDMVGIVYAQLPDIICGGFTGSEEKCVAILPPDNSKPSDEYKQTELYKYMHRAFKNYMRRRR